MSTTQLPGAAGKHDIKDAGLVELGRRRIAWAAQSMPVLAAIAQEKPVPVYFIGVGEKLEDLETFSAHEFSLALLG